MKNIIFGTGIVVTLTTLGFVLAGQLELTTFGVINTTVLSILYGWYQKLMKDTVSEDLSLSNLELEYVKHNHRELTKEADFLNHTLLDTHELLVRSENLRDQELKAYQSTVENLKLKLDSATAILPELQKVVESTTDEVKETKPKRKRNTKK